MGSYQDAISDNTMDYEQDITYDNIDLNGLQSAIDAPSAITQLENCKFLADTAARDEIKAILSDPTNASLDVSNRLVVGKQLAGGAQADVYEGILVTGDVDTANIRRMLKDKELLRKGVKSDRLNFKKVAVKQRRVYTFLEDANKGAKVGVEVIRAA